LRNQAQNGFTQPRSFLGAKRVAIGDRPGAATHTRRQHQKTLYARGASKRARHVNFSIRSNSLRGAQAAERAPCVTSSAKRRADGCGPVTCSLFGLLLGALGAPCTRTLLALRDQNMYIEYKMRQAFGVEAASQPAGLTISSHFSLLQREASRRDLFF
jgi:hypothetical protein